MEVEEVDLLVEVDFLEAAGPFLEVHITVPGGLGGRSAC